MSSAEGQASEHRRKQPFGFSLLWQFLQQVSCSVAGVLKIYIRGNYTLCYDANSVVSEQGGYLILNYFKRVFKLPMEKKVSIKEVVWLVV